MGSETGGCSLEEGYAEVRKAISQDLRKAVSEARHLAPEARDARLPSLRLGADLWPPSFVAGAVVEYEARRIEQLQAGQYVLALHDGAVAVRRFLDWTYDGSELKVVTKPGPRSRQAQIVPARALVGLVARVTGPGGETAPNRPGLSDYLAGVLSDYGTTTISRKIVRAAREALAILTTRPERGSRQATVLTLWRELMREEATRRREAGLQEPARSAAAQGPAHRDLDLDAPEDVLLRQLGFRPVD